MTLASCMSFTQRLHKAVDQKKSPLVVGLDPRMDRFPASVLESARTQHGNRPTWILAALKTFCFGVLGAVAPHCPAVKVNIGFFEQYHVPGLLAYAAVVAEAKRLNLLVIGDVKRSDIGSTAEAYAAGHLGATPEEIRPEQRLTVDAVTLNPYLGSDGIIPFIRTASDEGRGVYVLVRTSNPSSVELQQLGAPGETVCDHVARLVSEWGMGAGLADGYASVGAVVGATFPEELKRLRSAMPSSPFLVPGYGAQGATASDVGAAFDENGHGALINASRSILYAFDRGPEKPGNWEEAVAAAAKSAAEELEAVRHAPR